MDPLHDPRCLVTAEALFLDGANGVCGSPRHGAGQSASLASSLLFLGVLVLALIVRRRTPTGRNPAGRGVEGRALALATAALLMAAAPGMWAIITERADGPAAARTTAFGVARAHDQVHAFAAAHGGARLRTETETSIVPIARLALTGALPGGAAPIDLFDDTLEEGCREIDDALCCGTPP